MPASWFGRRRFAIVGNRYWVDWRLGERRLAVVCDGRSTLSSVKNSASAHRASWITHCISLCPSKIAHQTLQVAVRSCTHMRPAWAAYAILTDAIENKMAKPQDLYERLNSSNFCGTIWHTFRKIRIGVFICRKLRLFSNKWRLLDSLYHCAAAGLVCSKDCSLLSSHLSCSRALKLHREWQWLKFM